MRLGSPEWLILIPILIFIGWRWPVLGLRLPRRAICVGLLVLLLVQPEMRRTGRGLDLWVLVDQSASTQEVMAKNLGEWQSLLSRSKGSDDHLYFVDYAENPFFRDESDTSTAFESGRDGSRTALALQFALSRMSPDRASRVLVLSDGYSTESLSGLEGKLRAQGVAMDYRLAKVDHDSDIKLDSLVLPGRVQIAEPFLLEINLSGSPDGQVPLEIYRGATPIIRTNVKIQNGRGLARFTDKIDQPGGFEYTAVIHPAADSIAANNRISNWIEITAGPRILLVSAYPDDPLVGILRAQGFTVQLVDKPGTLTLGHLSGVKLVVFNNVPAYRIAPDFLKAIPFYVREQGGGFLMAGGKQSFGSGGFFQSPVDAILPVSMELRQEHRKLSVAMAIVMDRSGSMAVGVAGGKPGTTKMDLANEGSATAVGLLGDQDAITVFAVDSLAHEFVPLCIVGPNREKINDGIRRIQSTGGGIFVYEGLSKAWAELKKAQQGQKHVILFSDAADTEEPGQYKKLLAEMTKAGATVSVIGLGTEKDSDAELLKDIAKLGNGRIFFNANASELPALFAQETVAVARSTFIDEPTSTGPTAGWLEISARPIDWMHDVDGYNLSYLRADATSALNTKDEYTAPLVAFWQRGLGRSAAVSFPLGGDFSTRVRAWPAYGDFIQTLGRWLMGKPVPSGLSVRSTLEGEDLVIELLYDSTRELDLSLHPPRLALTGFKDQEVLRPTWERVAPGRFSTRMKLMPNHPIRGAVQAGEYILPFGPVILGRNEEWAFDEYRLEELATLATATAGQERTDLASIWKAPRRAEFRDFKQFLLITFLLAFLLDAFLTRTGYSLRNLLARKSLTAQVR
ncbi:MAG: VWA domain-containing protein [Verrucomicrobiota bacterium]|nr:VWA domain-containing protein [Verrucomicrobiota bacterium]